MDPTRISSADVDASDQLRAKLADLEASHARMKQANDLCPAAGWSNNLTDDEKKEAISNIRYWAGGTNKPFPALALSNANIRRVKERIAQLEKRDSANASSDFS